jgi:hypothetical protein
MSVLVSLILTIPLSIAANLLTPQILDRTSAWSRKRLIRRVKDLGAELKIIGEITETSAIRLCLKDLILGTVATAVSVIILFSYQVVLAFLFNYPKIKTHLEAQISFLGAKLPAGEVIWYACAILSLLLLILGTQIFIRAYRSLVRVEPAYRDDLLARIKEIEARYNSIGR